jgi:hypothetical protein
MFPDEDVCCGMFPEMYAAIGINRLLVHYYGIVWFVLFIHNPNKRNQ